VGRQVIYVVCAEGEEELAERLAEPLKEAGYDVAHNGTIAVGESLIGESEKAVASGAPIVLCATARAVGSAWAHRIVNAAHSGGLVRVFVVQMERQAYVDQLALDGKIARYCDDPAQAIKDLVHALAKNFPPNLTAMNLAREHSLDASGQFLDKPTEAATFDFEELEKFRAQLREEVAAEYPPSLTPWEFLSRAGLWVEGRLTRAGALLFAKNATAVCPTSIVKCTRYYGTDRAAAIRDMHTFEGTVPAQIIGALRFVTDRVRIGEAPKAGQAQSVEVYEYPMVAVREIIANALVHRDYASMDSCVHVRLFTDRLEVSSPGSWLGRDLNPGTEYPLSSLSGHSIKRNFRLAHDLSWIRLVEGEGTGIPSAVRDCDAMQSPSPTVLQDNGFVTVLLYRRRAPDEQDWRFGQDIDAPNRLVTIPGPEAGSTTGSLALKSQGSLAVKWQNAPITSKLYPPPVRKEWVEREELINQLSGSTAKLILVGAPAGFGKTTLIAQWRVRAVRERRFAWVSVDRGDNDPVRLWRHVVEALQMAGVELGEADLGQVLGTQQDLEGELLPLLINALARAQAPVVLVLDDYHLIRERSCLQQFEFLLLHLPPTVQVVLIARTDPPLPLFRMRATGELTEIRAKDLGFTPAEVASFIHTVAGVNLSDSDLANLVERTEGWPAGVYLGALSLRGNPAPHSFIQGFTGGNRFVVDFLSEEVLSRQPNHIRQFLTRTSILDRFSAQLCDAVTGTAGAAAIIEVLERENLFLVPLDDERQWFRYHQLFAQMLREQLARTEPEIVPDLHRRASAWYRAEGLPEEAIRHALAAGDADGAADLIARYWYEFVFAGRTSTVHRWIRSLGDAQIRSDPLLAHLAAWIAALRGEQDSVRRWLPVVEAGQHEGPLPDGMRSLRCSAALIHASFGFDGIAAMRRWAAAAVELEDDPASPWYALALGSLGWALYLSGEPGATAVLGQALLNEASIPPVRMLTLATSSLLATDEGRHGQASEFASAARRIADDSGMSDAPHSSRVWTAVASVHASQGKHEEARAEFERALGLRRRWIGLSPWESLDTLLRLAQMLIDTGDRAEATALVAEAREVLTSLPEGAQAQWARLNRLEQRLPNRPPVVKDLAEPLTKREEAVLRLLGGPLSLREIGQELYMSANTIKTHTRAIYRKLGATTRAEAVEQSRELGIS